MCLYYSALGNGFPFVERLAAWASWLTVLAPEEEHYPMNCIMSACVINVKVTSHSFGLQIKCEESCDHVLPGRHLKEEYSMFFVV